MNKERTKATSSWLVTSAVCAFGSGILAALIGSVITAITWFISAKLHPWLSGTGTALLTATIPLLIISGYCLDWNERDNAVRNRGRQGGAQEGRRNDLVRN